MDTNQKSQDNALPFKFWMLEIQDQTNAKSREVIEDLAAHHQDPFEFIRG